MTRGTSAPAGALKRVRHRKRKNYNQYFTPESGVEKALSLVRAREIKHIIDPAVGNGVFLKIAGKKWTKAKLYGVDIDAAVVHGLKKMNLGNATYFTSDSLRKETWKRTGIRKIISDAGFDLVVGNPPFSSWFQRIESANLLSDYRLARRNGKLKRSLAIEVLFTEIFIELAKEGGYVVVVLPDGILSNPQHRYVREFVLRETRIKYIMNLPRSFFADTSAKASVLILQKKRGGKLKYLTKFYDLEKTGRVNDVLQVRADRLINRMDYSYYHSLKRNDIGRLTNNGVRFFPLSRFVVRCKTGKTLYGKERKFANKGWRFLHATNITEIGINYKRDEKFIAPGGKMNFPSARAKVGDILFVRVGVGCAGRVAIVDGKKDEGVATDYIHIFKVKGTNPYFIVLYLKTRFGRGSIDALKHGVGTVSINKGDLLSLPIPVVGEDVEAEIERRFRGILTAYRTKGENDALRRKMSLLVDYLEEEIDKRSFRA